MDIFLITFIILIFLQGQTDNSGNLINEIVQLHLYWMRKQQLKHQLMTHYEFILGPVKIKDGVFMGDELAAKDIEFIISNKVTHVINTVCKQIPNLWERFGVQYLSVNWTQKQQNIFDKKNNSVNAIFNFIEEAMELGQSCLVHSVNGKSRASCVIIVYLMKKYNWSLNKCLEYINTKKEHLEIRSIFLQQLQQFENRLIQIHNLTNGWKQTLNQQDLVLKNTLLNSKPLEKMEKPSLKSNKKKVTFAPKPTVNKFNSTQTQINNAKDNSPDIQLKPILKGYKDEFQGKEVNKNSNQQTQTEDIKKLRDSNFINNINGNIVHVTVNNFITTDKKPENVSKTMGNVRPSSSDTKQRQKNLQTNKMGRIMGYDQFVNFSSPYDASISSKINSNNKIKKKDEEIKSFLTNERPQSANITAQKRKMKNFNIINTPTTIKKEQGMMVYGKKRYPSTNPRQQFYKWK